MRITEGKLRVLIRRMIKESADNLYLPELNIYEKEGLCNLIYDLIDEFFALDRDVLKNNNFLKPGGMNIKVALMHTLLADDSDIINTFKNLKNLSKGKDIDIYKLIPIVNETRDKLKEKFPDIVEGINSEHTEEIYSGYSDSANAWAVMSYGEKMNFAKEIVGKFYDVSGVEWLIRRAGYLSIWGIIIWWSV